MISSMTPNFIKSLSLSVRLQMRLGAPQHHFTSVSGFSLREYQPVSFIDSFNGKVCGGMNVCLCVSVFWPDTSGCSCSRAVMAEMGGGWCWVLSSYPWCPGLRGWRIEVRREEEGFKRPSIKLELASNAFLRSFCTYKGKIYPIHSKSVSWELEVETEMAKWQIRTWLLQRFDCQLKLWTLKSKNCSDK